ncbi:unnamed protein product [Lampetra fluviatilis]
MSTPSDKRQQCCRHLGRDTGFPIPFAYCGPPCYLISHLDLDHDSLKQMVNLTDQAIGQSPAVAETAEAPGGPPPDSILKTDGTGAVGGAVPTFKRVRFRAGGHLSAMGNNQSPRAWGLALRHLQRQTRREVDLDPLRQHNGRWSRTEA